jgi:hypothetical protein
MNPSPNFTKFNFANKSTMSPFSSKLIPHTPSHKNQDGQQAIKRISNFSYALSD